MRSSLTIVFLLALNSVVSGSAAPPKMPCASEVVRYERIRPLFLSNTIDKQLGDALRSAFEGGRKIQRREVPQGIVCALPAPAHHWINITLTNKCAYRIGVSSEGGLVYLPEGLYEVANEARESVAQVIQKLDKDLRQEIMSAPKPCTYIVSTTDDGGTLSGIAGLFYGDATKWKIIYEANRNTLKSPNVINSGQKLTIPKL